jgi:hypothetical protein
MKRPLPEIKSGQAPTAKGFSGSCNRGIKKLRTFGKFAAYSFWSGRQDCFALFVFSGRNSVPENTASNLLARKGKTKTLKYHYQSATYIITIKS